MTKSQKNSFEVCCEENKVCNSCPKHHTQRFLSSIFDNLPDMIFVKDAEELRFVDFNKAGEKLIGYLFFLMQSYPDIDYGICSRGKQY